MFAAAMTVQMLMSVASLWVITLRSIASCVDVAH